MACSISKCIPPNLFIPYHGRRNPSPPSPSAQERKNLLPPDISTIKDLSFFFRFCIVQCGARQSIQVLHPNGHIFEFRHTVLAADLLRAHPHHYLCNAADGKGAILPYEATLENGNIYMLLPVPRLFPTSAPSCSSCSCYSKLQGGPKSPFETFSVFSSPRKGTIPWSPKVSKVSQDAKHDIACAMYQDAWSSTAKSPYSSAAGRTKEMLLCRHAASKAINGWKPKLQSILEDDLFVFVEECDKFPPPRLARPKHRSQHLLNNSRKQQQLKMSWCRHSRSPLLSANPLFIF